MAVTRSFVIRQVVDDRVPVALAFHRDHLTEYLWPRTRDEFEALVQEESLYEAVERTGGANDIVGICYVTDGEEPQRPGMPRLEFGGVYVTDECRGLGVAKALGIIAISNAFAWDPPQGRLIGHVHEANPLPRPLMERLGFVLVGQEIPPPEVAPPTMARNARGEVVGDLFEFRRETLARFADWIEAFDGRLVAERERVVSQLEVQLPLMVAYRPEALVALRNIASNS